MRVDKIKDFAPMRILAEEDMRADRLSEHMHDMLQIKPAIKALPIDLNGAANAAKFLRRWVEENCRQGIDYD
jgi:predicted glycosyltransferase